MTEQPPIPPLAQRPPFRFGLRSCSCLLGLLSVLFLCVCGVAFVVQHW